MLSEEIAKWINKVLENEGLDLKPQIEYPKDFKFGDYSTNVALVSAKQRKCSAMELAKIFTDKLNNNLLEIVDRVEVVPPGFINIFLKDQSLIEGVLQSAQGKNFSNQLGEFENKKIVVEYTDPNPFKEFHIGHLMTNTIGEAMAGILENVGAKVVRVCYQGDVGMHTAKAIYGALLYKNAKKEIDWKLVYQKGAKAYDDGGEAKIEIENINKKIYSREDDEINQIYDEGKKWSLSHFEEIYKMLGTKFDHYFFESEVADLGVELVKNNLGKVFEESDGAIIFPGEKYGLHNRVFINSKGLPTYEAKELGLAETKKRTFSADSYLVITGNEINEYFKVLKKSLELIDADLANKISHLGHGMLRLSNGKMSSRTGQVITAESLIEAIKRIVFEKVDKQNWQKEDLGVLTEKIAVGAFKYSILKQSVGGDIIFDFEKSISFEGDSGPYLMYSYARARSVLRKKTDLKTNLENLCFEKDERDLAILIHRFSDLVQKSAINYSPHFLIQYLIELSSIFNRFYANNKIIDSGLEEDKRLILTQAFSEVLKKGLQILSIPVLEKM